MLTDLFAFQRPCFAFLAIAEIAIEWTHNSMPNALPTVHLMVPNLVTPGNESA
jgi:hypothetical protein